MATLAFLCLYNVYAQPRKITPVVDSKVVIYQHSNYQGLSKQFGIGKFDIAQLGIGNDQLSSIKIPKNLRVILYADGNYKGKTMTLTENTTFVGDFNDLTSSIVVESASTKPVENPNNNVATLPSFKGCAKGTENVPAENEAFEKSVLEIVNKERKKVGKPALVWNTKLARAARYHAADMAIDGYFDHDSHDVIDGKEVRICGAFDRIGKFGSGFAENIAWGSDTPEGAMKQWINSPGHYANIMSGNTSVGIGFYKNYWVQVFGPKE